MILFDWNSCVIIKIVIKLEQMAILNFNLCTTCLIAD
jgi:hypothetical protein